MNCKWVGANNIVLWSDTKAEQKNVLDAPFGASYG